jgi:hypothetical protein
MSDAEREKLHASIERSIALPTVPQIRRRTIDVWGTNGAATSRDAIMAFAARTKDGDISPAIDFLAKLRCANAPR